jgi:hypothetical protein
MGVRLSTNNPARETSPPAFSSLKKMGFETVLLGKRL